MINTLSKINLSKIGWEGGGSTSIWIMSVNILGGFLDGTPRKGFKKFKLVHCADVREEGRVRNRCFSALGMNKIR